MTPEPHCSETASLPSYLSGIAGSCEALPTRPRVRDNMAEGSCSVTRCGQWKEIKLPTLRVGIGKSEPVSQHSQMRVEVDDERVSLRRGFALIQERPISVAMQRKPLSPKGDERF